LNCAYGKVGGLGEEEETRVQVGAGASRAHMGKIFSLGRAVLHEKTRSIGRGGVRRRMGRVPGTSIVTKAAAGASAMSEQSEA